MVLCCCQFSEVLQDIKLLDIANTEWGGLVLYSTDNLNVEEDKNTEGWNEDGGQPES